MATKIRGITVEIGGDTSGLEKSLKTVNGNIGDTTKQLKDVERLLKLDPTNVELLAQKQELLSRRVEQSFDKLETLKKAQETMDKNGIDKNTSQYMALQREIIQTQKAVEDDTDEIDKLTKAEKKNADSADADEKAHVNLGGAVKAAGAAAAAATAALVGAGKAIWDAAKATAEHGDEIDKGAQKLQISTDLYQKLGYAASMSGADIEDVKKGVINITNALADMNNGVANASAKWDVIGVSLTDADGNLKSTEDVLLDTIDALASMEDETQRNAAANDIFGKNYSELLPLLNSGADGISELMQEAEDYGMIMSEDAVKASADFSDALERLNDTFRGLKEGAMGELLPSLTEIINGISSILAGDMTGTEKIREGIQNLIAALNNAIPDIVSFIGSVAEAVIVAAPEILRSLSDGIVNALPELMPAIIDTVVAIAEFLMEELPVLVETAIEIVLALVEGITEALPELIPAAVDMINSIIDALIDNLDLLIDAAIELLIALSLGLIDNLPRLVERIPELIAALVEAIIENTPQLLWASIQILIAIGRGLIESISVLVKKVPELISGLGEAFGNAWEDLKEIGGNIIEGISEGISNAWESVKEWVTNAVNNLVGWVKDLLGIASPSKVFASIGNFMALGLGEGFTDEMDKVTDDMLAAVPALDMQSSFAQVVTRSTAESDASTRRTALQQAAAGVVNGVNSIVGGGGEYTFNLVLPTGEVLARYQLPALIDVARSSGTPILNPVMG